MQCDGCTLCCKVLEIPEVESKFNEWCQHCNEDGCKIYPDRPEGCRNFNCAWLQMNVVASALRPDNCGVVFEKFSDSVMAGVTDGHMEPVIKGQVTSFNREGISVVMFNHSNKRKAHFLADGHTIDFVEGELNDSRIIH